MAKSAETGSTRSAPLPPFPSHHKTSAGFVVTDEREKDRSVPSVTATPPHTPGAAPTYTSMKQATTPPQTQRTYTQTRQRIAASNTKKGGGRTDQTNKLPGYCASNITVSWRRVALGHTEKAKQSESGKFGLRLAQLSALRLHSATASCGCCFSLSFPPLFVRRPLRAARRR